MGELYNQFTGSVDDSPFTEKQKVGDLNLAMEEASSVSPDKAARVLSMQKLTGLPAPVVDENLDDIEKVAASKTFNADDFRTKSPTVAGWMAQSPQHAAVIKDETNLWGGLEKAVASAKDSWENERDMAERNSLLMEEFNGRELSPVEQARSEKLKGDMLHRAQRNQSEATSEYVARTNASGVYQLASSMKSQIKGASIGGSLLGVAGFVAGGPPMAAAGMALGATSGAMYSGGVYSYNMETPMFFDDMRNMKDINGQKMDIETARNVARVTGVLLATVEIASGAAVTSMIPGVRGIIGKATGADVAKEAIKNQVKLAMSRPTSAAAIRNAVGAFLAVPATESLEEFVQAMISAGGREVAQSVSGQYFAPDDFSKDLEAATQQARDAFIGSLFAMGAPVGGARLYHSMREVKAAKQSEAYYQALGEATEGSKAYQSLPGEMRKIVDGVTKNGPIQDVYVDVNQWRAYFQNKNVDPREAAKEVWGTATEYDNAVATDASMRLPIGEYAAKIATTEHRMFFQKEIRRAPDAMNAREAEEVEKEMEAFIKESADPTNGVRSEVSSRLVKLGYEQSTADTMASQMGEFFNTQAAKLGILDPLALFNRYGVDINRDENPAPGAMAQPQESVQGAKQVAKEAVRAELASGRVSSDYAFRGTSPSELQHIASTGELLIGADAEGNAGISAATIHDGNFPVYGSGVGIIAPPSAFESPAGAVEVLINPKTDPRTLQYVVGGKVLSFDGMKAAVTVYAQKKSEFLANLFGDNLTKAYENDKGVNKSIAEDGDDSAVTPLQIVEFIKATTGSQYLDWATRRYVKGEYFLEDATRLGRYLRNFDLVKRVLPNKDIGQFKTLIALERAVDEAMDNGLEPTSKEKRAEAKAKAYAESEITYKDGELTVVVPKTMFASQFFGKGTRWCTAARDEDENRFHDYNENGPLYIIMTDKGKKYQFYFGEMSQFMDAEDNSLTMGEFGAPGDGFPGESGTSVVRAYPKLKEVFGDKALEFGEIWLMRDEDAANEDNLLRAIEIDSSRIRDIQNPSERLQLAAIADFHEEMITYIDNPTERVKLEVIRNRPDMLYAIDNPSEAVQLAALNESTDFDHFNHPTAVKNAVEMIKVGVERGDMVEFQSVTEKIREMEIVGIKAAVPTTYKQDYKGFITIKDDKKMAISLTGEADLSTFLHESGHLYLEVLRDLSSPSGWEKIKQLVGQELKDGPQRTQMLEDSGRIAAWLGADNLDNLTAEQHEQFARGIEAYFMEGRSPSVELRPVFARFRAWLVALYRTVAGLRVRLNPEIRAVMDRMFATQEAIDAANKEAEVVPVFTTAQDAGMSDAEFAAYNNLLINVSTAAQDELQQKIMRQLQREQEAEWARRRDEIRSEVAEQLSSVREYSVLSLLSDSDSKLSRDALVSMFPDPYKDNLVMQSLHRMDLYRSKGGLDPNTVAKDNGYTSADEMIKALITVKPYEQAVDEQTDVRMKGKYGDILTDGTLADEAKSRVLGPGRSEVLAVELRALRKRQRETRPIVSAVVREAKAARSTGMDNLQTSVPSLSFVRHVAEGTVAQMQIRTLNAQTHLVAARNASKAAIESVHRGDYHIAAYHKQKELLNVEMYREVQRVKQEAAKIAEFMHTMEESKVRERLARAGDFYLEQIDAILERFNFSKLTTKEANKRKSLVEWVKKQQEAGAQVNIPEDVLNEAYRKPWKDMTYDELLAVSDTVKHIKHLAVLKNKLLKSKANRELSATINLIDETMAINARHKPSGERETRLPQEMASHALAGFFAAHRKIASLAREMDGFVDGGPVWESVIWPLNEAAAKEAFLHEQSNAVLTGLFNRYATVSEKAKTMATSLSMGVWEAGMYKQEFIPEINGSLSKVAKIMVLLNWGNEGNRQRIMDGYNWTEQQVEAVISTLTKDDWDFAQGVWDHFESFWPEIEALSKRVDGIAPKKVQATPLLSPFGEYRGGYFPLSYDDRQSPRAYAHLAKEAADRAMHGAAVRAVTAHGERINRQQNVKMPVRLDFGVITESLSETIHDITHYETLIDLNRILGNPRIQRSMVGYFGYEVYQQFRSALRDVAGGDIPAQTHVDKSLNWLRKGTTISSLGWNVVTGLMQPLGFAQSVVRVGPVWVAKGVGRWLGSAVRMENTVKWIYEKSALMQERSISQSREINEIRNQVSPSGLLSPVQDSFFYLIVKMQQIVDVPTWLGAYEKGMEQFSGDEAKAIAAADQSVLDSQGGGQIKDRAAIQRGGPAQMLWTNFYSYWNTTFNLTAEKYRGTKFSNPYQAGRFMADMIILYTVPAVLGMLLRDVLRGTLEDDPDKLMKKLIREQLAYMASTVLLVREVTGVIQGYHGYEGPAGARFFSESAKLVKQLEQGDADEAMVESANRWAGILFHYPAGQVQKIVEGVMYDIDEGTANPVPILVGPPKD